MAKKQTTIREQVEALQVKSFERKERQPKPVVNFEGLSQDGAFELAETLVAENPGLALNTAAIQNAGDTRRGGNAMIVRLDSPEGTPRSQRQSFTAWHSGKGQAAGFPNIVEQLTAASASIR